MASIAPVLSIIVPVFNEAETIILLLKKLRQHQQFLPSSEIIVVNDGSTDHTKTLLNRNSQLTDTLIHRRQNYGKGMAIRLGFRRAKGQIVLVQDADLEYDPADIPRLIQPLLDHKADVVYGTRFSGSQPHRVVYYWHYVANKILTTCSNICTNLNLSDIETGYKAIRRSYLRKFILTENDFAIEVELTAKLAKTKARFYEVGISYYGRTYEEGKKITLKDAFKALWAIIKYNLL